MLVRLRDRQASREYAWEASVPLFYCLGCYSRVSLPSPRVPVTAGGCCGSGFPVPSVAPPTPELSARRRASPASCVLRPPLVAVRPTRPVLGRPNLHRPAPPRVRHQRRWAASARAARRHAAGMSSSARQSGERRRSVEVSHNSTGEPPAMRYSSTSKKSGLLLKRGKFLHRDGMFLLHKKSRFLVLEGPKLSCYKKVGGWRASSCTGGGGLLAARPTLGGRGGGGRGRLVRLQAWALLHWLVLNVVFRSPSPAAALFPIHQQLLTSELVLAGDVLLLLALPVCLGLHSSWEGGAPTACSSTTTGRKMMTSPSTR